jgi:hypothetical protein
MSSHKQHSVRLTKPAHKANTPASRMRKKFKLLSEKLEAARAQLRLWKETMPIIQGKVEGEFDTLVAEHIALQRALVLLFDRMHEHKALGKREREKLEIMICTGALDVLDTGEDAEIKEIYTRYSGDDLDDDSAEENAMIQEMLEQAFGVEFDEHPARSREELFEAARAQMDERREHEQAAQAEGATRPKSAAALAREARQQAETARLQQSVRDIFRKLTSALHPDRERDPAERARKTALMQRVNVAYGDNDLLALLALQLEVEQIDQDHLDGLDDERIKQYNKILEGQLDEVGHENREIATMAAMMMGADSPHGMTPRMALSALNREIDFARQEIALATKQVSDFEDIKKLKAYLKTLKAAPPGGVDDDLWY